MNLLKFIQRPINPNHFIPEIDGFRFFAIFTVCLLHLNNFYGRNINYDYYQNVRDINSWNWFINRSGLGVEIFFSISGFVIALPFIKHYLFNIQKPSIKQYFYRRLTRLEIPYIFTCVIFYITYYFTINGNMLDEIGHLLASITYTHELIYGYWAPFNPVTWSLEVEIQFYILAPTLIHFLFSNKNRYIILTKTVALTAIPLVLKFYFYEWLSNIHLHMSIIIFLPYFLIGFIVAYIYVTNITFLNKRSFLYDFIGFASFYLLFYFIWGPNQLYFCITSLVVFISIFKGKILNSIFTNRYIYIIGGMCYSIYLIHYPTFHLLGNIIPSFTIFENYMFNFIIQVIIFIPISFIIWSIFYISIEKPCMDKNWPQKLNNKIKIFIK